MKVGVVTFPGSNCDRDMRVALAASGADVHQLWHKDTSLPQGLDLVVLPGGFSYGDYLRCGAIAAHSPLLPKVRHATRTQRRLLPRAALYQLRNHGLYLCVADPTAGLLRLHCHQPRIGVCLHGSTITASPALPLQLELLVDDLLHLPAR